MPTAQSRLAACVYRKALACLEYDPAWILSREALGNQIVEAHVAGLPMGTWLGHKVTLELLGHPEGATPCDGRRFPISPSILGFLWFMPILTTWARWQDWGAAAAKGR